MEKSKAIKELQILLDSELSLQTKQAIAIGIEAIKEKMNINLPHAFNIGDIIKTNYGIIRCGDNIACEDCVLFDTEANVGIPWKERDSCWNLFPCGNQHEREGVAYELMPSDSEYDFDMSYEDD
jgi:hypothetical protein